MSKFLEKTGLLQSGLTRGQLGYKMNGPVAQIVALTCHGNAFLGGEESPQFFSGNSTCRFCDSVNFVEFKQRLFRRQKEIEFAKSPDEWMESLRARGAKGIRLVRQAHNNPEIADRKSGGFVGGGGTWMMELTKDNGQSEFWAARWDVWNQNAPDKRIWRVSYGLLSQARTRPYSGREIADVKSDFRDILTAIHRFSEREDCGGFTNCFADAIKVMEDPGADIGYHKDLALPEQLSDDVQAMLKASMSAWVFGGMGSWNDMGFDGAAQQEYKSVSDSLFDVLNEAIEVSANSTLPIQNVK